MPMCIIIATSDQLCDECVLKKRTLKIVVKVVAVLRLKSLLVWIMAW